MTQISQMYREPGGARVSSLRPAGAGHFVKMVHKGIEYGRTAAYAEALNVLKHADAACTGVRSTPKRCSAV